MVVKTFIRALVCAAMIGFALSAVAGIPDFGMSDGDLLYGSR